MVKSRKKSWLFLPYLLLYGLGSKTVEMPAASTQTLFCYIQQRSKEETLDLYTLKCSWLTQHCTDTLSSSKSHNSSPIPQEHIKYYR